MPRYPYRFIQGDALEYIVEHGREFDAIHASPPCQGYSVTRSATGRESPRLIGQVRELLNATGRPYVIENVEGAESDMQNYVLLCGTMFGLRVRRHRLFELSPVPLLLTSTCDCRNGVIKGRLIGQRVAGKVAPGRTKPPHHTESDRREAIGVPWMTTMEARQAIPPEYTRFIGAELMQIVALAAAS
jgi:DNA (cytosine-5)-methyltransferase 1